MTQQGTLHRLAAFTSDPEGGNPAGVWIGEQLPEQDEMQKIAQDVGYSETAFIAPREGLARTIRYFSAEQEVSFCGHATIASGVALGQLDGDATYVLASPVGEIPVRVETVGNSKRATLTSVEPRHEAASEELTGEALALLGWKADDLDPDLPPARAYAGAWHLVLAVRNESTLADLAYDFDAMKTLMQKHEVTTLQLVWRAEESLFHSRNPFPVGGVFEDPATGAAAAALAGYLRSIDLVEPPAELTVLQGAAMGRPSRLEVRIPATGGIEVSGAAAPLSPSHF